MFHLVSRNDDILGIVREIATWKERGVDTETYGVGYGPALFSIAIDSGEKGFYFNFNPHAPETPAEYVLDGREVSVLLNREVFSNQDALTFIHNAKFDLDKLRRFGIEVEGTIHCTMAIERVLRNNHFGKGAYSLAGAATRRGWEKDERVEQYITKHKLYTVKNIPGKKKAFHDKHFSKVPFPIMAAYAGMDARLHAKLGKDQLAELAAMPQLERLIADTRPSLVPVFENERKLTKTVFKMEQQGVRIDREFVNKAAKYEAEQIDSAKRAFQSHTDEPYREERKLFTRLFDAAGEPYPITEAGNPSFAADVLEGMSSPIAALINTIRHHEKRLNTYYSSFLLLAHGDRLHADAVQCGTEPGRFSYRDPNLQNVPKEDEDEDQGIPYHIRESFIPDEGCFIYSLDFKQMEYCMMADYAGEMDLIRQVLAGADFHQVTAELCGITRKQAKTLNFALLYGAGIGKIVTMLGCTPAEAMALKALYFGRLPRVKRFINEVMKRGEGRGFIWNWFGRRCHIARRDWAYILPNHTIQGGCADVVKIAMVRIDARLQELRSPTKMDLQVHDELRFMCPFGDERIVEEIQPIMETVYPGFNGMILRTSVEHSFKSWGHRDKIKGVPYARVS